MNHTDEGVLKLLQDIKELLLGIALLLLGGIFFIAGLLLLDTVFVLLSVAGIVFLFCGGLHIWYGWTAHTVVEKSETVENMKT